MDLLTELSFCQDSRIFRDSLSLTLFFYIYISPGSGPIFISAQVNTSGHSLLKRRYGSSKGKPWKIRACGSITYFR